MNQPVPLSIGVVAGPATSALAIGSVSIAGADSTVDVVHPSELFMRQLTNQHYDVSELSIASLCIAYARGDRSWKALPIFTDRRFFYNEALVREGAGINSPSDLAGRRVALPEYQQTAAVWARGILTDEFGVSPRDVHWYMERPAAQSHGGATGFRAPQDVRISTIESSSSIAQMLAKGELDAALHYIGVPSALDRSTSNAESIPRVRTLFDDPLREGLRYYQKTGILPMNHCVVVRASLAEAHPWLLEAVRDAFGSSKNSAMTSAQKSYGPLTVSGLATFDFGTDPLPYDVQGTQRLSLETLMRYLDEQGLTERRISVDEIFSVT